MLGELLKIFPVTQTPYDVEAIFVLSNSLLLHIIVITDRYTSYIAR